jgi:hypothetical protein
VQSLPTKLDALEKSTGSASWAGPYIVSSGIDRLSGLPGAQADAWGQAYTLKSAGSSAVVIGSAGSDHAAGTTDDISLTVDVTPIRREISLERLRTINQAVRQYNAQYLGSSNLSSDWGTAFGQLVKTGFLPDDAQYKTDGWGDAFVPDPQGAKPVVRVNSVHLSGGAGSVPISKDKDKEKKEKDQGKGKDKEKDSSDDKDNGKGNDDKDNGKGNDDKDHGKGNDGKDKGKDDDKKGKSKGK